MVGAEPGQPPPAHVRRRLHRRRGPRHRAARPNVRRRRHRCHSQTALTLLPQLLLLSPPSRLRPVPLRSALYRRGAAASERGSVPSTRRAPRAWNISCGLIASCIQAIRPFRLTSCWSANTAADARPAWWLVTSSRTAWTTTPRSRQCARTALCASCWRCALVRASRCVNLISAFLNGELEEEVYVRPPAGAPHIASQGSVLRLLRALHGLRQASRAWLRKLEAELRARRLVPSDADPAVWKLYGEGEGDTGHGLRGTQTCCGAHGD